TLAAGRTRRCERGGGGTHGSTHGRAERRHRLDRAPVQGTGRRIHHRHRGSRRDHHVPGHVLHPRGQRRHPLWCRHPVPPGGLGHRSHGGAFHRWHVPI